MTRARWIYFVGRIGNISCFFVFIWRLLIGIFKVAFSDFRFVDERLVVR